MSPEPPANFNIERDIPTATSALSLAAGLSSSFADPSVDLGEDQVTFLVYLVGIIK